MMVVCSVSILLTPETAEISPPEVRKHKHTKEGDEEIFHRSIIRPTIGICKQNRNHVEYSLSIWYGYGMLSVRELKRRKKVAHEHDTDPLQGTS